MSPLAEDIPGRLLRREKKALRLKRHTVRQFKDPSRFWCQDCYSFVLLAFDKAARLNSKQPCNLLVSFTSVMVHQSRRLQVLTGGLFAASQRLDPIVMPGSSQHIAPSVRSVPLAPNRLLLMRFRGDQSLSSVSRAYTDGSHFAPGSCGQHRSHFPSWKCVMRYRLAVVSAWNPRYGVGSS